MGITLPGAPREEALRLSPKSVLFYGPSKLGKTDFCGQLPGNLILDIIEHGTDDKKDIMAVNIDTYEEMQDVTMQLAVRKKKEGKPPYRFLTLDTLDQLEGFAVHRGGYFFGQTNAGKKWYAENYEREGVLRPGGSDVLQLPGKDFSPGYRWLWAGMKWYIAVYKELCDHLICVCHIREKRIADITGAEDVTAYDLSLTGKLASIVAADMDVIGYMYRDKTSKLMINFNAGNVSVMGSRYKYLAGQRIEADWSRIFIDYKLPTNEQNHKGLVEGTRQAVPEQ